MTATYLPEPRTAAEVIARAHAVNKRRWLGKTPAKTRADIDAVIRMFREQEAARREAERVAEEERKRKAEAEERRRIASSERVRAIIMAVSDDRGIPVSVILGQRRTAPIVSARWEAIARVAIETGWSLPRIGLVFGRDHTSILNALRKMGLDYRSFETRGRARP